MSSHPVVTSFSLEEGIQKFIPHSLDQIIRLHRNKASLRPATPKDLQELTGEVNVCWNTGDLSQVCFYKRIYHDGKRSQQIVTLVGYDRTDMPFHTSEVVKYDPIRNKIETSSGSIYTIHSINAGVIPEELLVMICAMLWKDGIGEVLGVPRFEF